MQSVVGTLAPEDSAWALLPPGLGGPSRRSLDPLVAPRAGALLLSHPKVGSPGETFYRSVVLLCSHDDVEGTTGVVLNAPTRDSVGSLLLAPATEHPHAVPMQRGRMLFPPGKRLSSSALAAIRVMQPRVKIRRDGSLLVSFVVPAPMAEATASAIATAMEQRHRQAIPNALRDEDEDDGGAFHDAGDEQSSALDDVLGDCDDLDQRSLVLDHPTRDRRDSMWAARQQHELSSSSDDDIDDAFSDSDSDSDDEHIDGRMLRQLLVDDLEASRHASRRAVVDSLGADLLSACGASTLSYGGPVTGATVLHACPSVGGEAILPGVYAGGDARALATALRSGNLRQDDVRVFAGQASWAPGQLQEELARGEWLVAQATPAWVLSRHSRRGSRFRAPLGAGAHQRGAPASSCLWSRALNAMGGEWAALSLLPRGVDLDGEEAASETPVVTVRP